MFRASPESALLALTVTLWTAVASAQNPPLPPAPDDDEDLEVPASQAPAATPTPTVPAPATDGPPATSAEPTEAKQAAPPASAAAAPATTSETAEPAEPAAAPEEPQAATRRGRSVHFRPVPSGFRIGGYLQAQYQHSALSEDQLLQGGSPLNQNEFLVRRGRLRLDRGWEYAAASVELDANTFQGPSIGIRRAEGWLFYRGDNPDHLPPLVALGLGVVDIPFGFDLLESARVRWFMDRSLGSLALFPTEADAGVKLAGAFSFLRYAVALMNGEPVDSRGFPRDPNSAKDLIGRLGAEVAFGEKLELGGGTSFAFGKGFHAGQDAGKSTLIWRDLNEDGTQQPGEFFGIPGSAATPSENFERWAIGLDLGVSFQSFLGLSQLQAEAFVASNYDRGFSPSDPVVTSLDVRQAGGFVALTQELTRYGIVGFRASLYDPNSDVIETRANKPLPKTQTVRTFSPLVGLVLPERARLLFQYDFIRDYLARDAVGVPTDADNDQWTLRLQVEL